MIMKSEEIWKKYPEFDFIEGSSFGRVKTLDRFVKCGEHKQHVKGRILKQHLRRSGYLQVGLNADGKYINLSVHRIIASCFLKNPKKFPQVNHKDCDPTNNRADNLEWCSREYNRQYREKYGKASGRPVYAVNLKTQKILYFESRMEVERELGVAYQNINKITKGKQNQAGGYWFTEDKSKITREKLNEIKANMHYRGGVLAVNLKTQEVLYFRSRGEAGRSLRVEQSCITRVVKGQRNRSGDFWFTNADKNVVENVRAKFGDPVANKVEELMKK